VESRESASREAGTSARLDPFATGVRYWGLCFWVNRDPWELTVLDLEGARRRYAAERDKRIRPDGIAQYVPMTGALAGFRRDPFDRPDERPARHDHVTVTVVGGGMAGLVTGALLHEAGVADVRIVERGGGFGGVWYWNRYPGAACDTASMIYLPLLEQTGYVPADRYARGPEILAHCDRIAARYGLAAHALLHTCVTSLTWDATRTCWTVRTDRDDEFTSQFVVIGTGGLDTGKLPGVPGIETFRGHSFHTSRWDYAYTGGDPEGAPLDRLATKRTAIIGTGATAVQCIPHLARSSKELFVFQRTPASVDVRVNSPIDREWFASVASPGWQQQWLENFCANLSAGEFPAQDLVNDEWTDLAKRVRRRLSEPRPGPVSSADLQADIEALDLEKMSEIRERVDAVVRDPATAARLKAWHRQLCKRPCFHEEYLSVYNLPSVHLVDTDGKGVQKITADGVVAAGVEYPVDCIIYASGFEVAPTRSYDFEMTGRCGQRLTEYWSAGMRSLHGIHVHGFPNAFFFLPAQGANFAANIPHNLTDMGQTIAAIVSHMRGHGLAEVEAMSQAESAWLRQLEPSPSAISFLSSCTPGYYNNEGHIRPEAFWNGYRHGSLAYFRLMSRWRKSGDFQGLEFGQRPPIQRQDA
jgi:cation diffusion facilitator CzcD-associated flavoprotein CzcO